MRGITSRRALLVIGFTAQLLLVSYAVWFGSVETVVKADAYWLPQAVMYLRSFCFALTFIAGAVVAQVAPKVFGWQLALGMWMLLCAGAVCQVINLAAPSAGLGLAASALSSSGTAGFFMLWERVFAYEKTCFVGVCLGISMSISGVVYAALFSFADTQIATMVLVVLTGGVLLYVCRTAPATCDGSIVWSKKAKSGTLPSFFLEMWPTLLCVVSIYLVSSITRTAAAHELSDYGFFDRASMLSMVLSGVFLIVFWRLSKNNASMSRVYQAIFPFVATGFLALPFLGEAFYACFVGFTFFFVSIIASLIMLSSLQMGKANGYQPVFVYGVLGGACYLSVPLGDFLGAGVRLLGEYGFVQILTISFVCLYILSMTSLALHKRNAKRLEEDAAREKEGRDRFAEVCAELDARYGLTPREAEIMRLIAKGRDLPTISESLFISKSTVQTHSKSLYRKLGIHSKQELIDLVESGEGKDRAF